MSNLVSDIPDIFSAHLDELYQQLRHDLQEIWLPEKERLARALLEASFRSFDCPTQYLENARALQYPWRLSSTLGREVYRVYFNEHSRKVYVDLNASRTGDYFQAPAGVLQLGAEIIRSIMFTDPRLLLEEEGPAEVSGSPAP